MTPREMVKRYAECKEVCSQNPDTFPLRTKPGKLMQMADCAKEMLKIEEEHRNFIKNHAFVIVLKGSAEAQKKWLEVAHKEAEILSIRADKLYREFATVIEPSIGDRKTFGTSQLTLLIQAMIKGCKDLGLQNMPTPQLLDLSHVKNTEELVNCIRLLIRSSSGDQFNQAFIEQQVQKQALEIGYTRSVVPVVLAAATDDEGKELGSKLFTGKTFSADAEKNKKEEILSQLAEIRNLLQKK